MKRPASIDSDFGSDSAEERGCNHPFNLCCPSTQESIIEYPNKHELTTKRNHHRVLSNHHNNNNHHQHHINNINYTKHINHSNHKNHNQSKLPPASTLLEQQTSNISLSTESSLFSYTNQIERDIEPILKDQLSINTIDSTLSTLSPHEQPPIHHPLHINDENQDITNLNHHNHHNQLLSTSTTSTSTMTTNDAEDVDTFIVAKVVEIDQNKSNEQQQTNDKQIDQSQQQQTLHSSHSLHCDMVNVQQKVPKKQLPQITTEMLKLTEVDNNHEEETDDPFADDFKYIENGTTEDEVQDDVDPFINDFDSLPLPISKSNQLPINNKIAFPFYSPSTVNAATINSFRILPSTTSAVDSDDFDEFKEDDAASSLGIESDRDDDVYMNTNEHHYYLNENQLNQQYGYVNNQHLDDNDNDYYPSMNHPKHIHQMIDTTKQHQQQQQHIKGHDHIDHVRVDDEDEHKQQQQQKHDDHHQQHIEQSRQNNVYSTQLSMNNNSQKSSKSDFSQQSSSNNYLSNFSSYSSENSAHRQPPESLKYKQDFQSLPQSLSKYQLTWNNIYDLLMRHKVEHLTDALIDDGEDDGQNEDMVINKNDTIDSTDTVVDEEEENHDVYQAKYDGIQYIKDNNNNNVNVNQNVPLIPNILMDPYDKIKKYSFVALCNNELVFVKITKTDEYREKLITNMIKNDLLMSWWIDGDYLTEEEKRNPPFLQLRGWYLDDCSPLAAVIYPYHIKLSTHLKASIVCNSDFIEFEQYEDDEEQNKINWDLNLHHMGNIRDSLFRIAEIVANLHIDGVSHRNINIDNIFVDYNNPKQFYLINYAQNKISPDLYLSPEGHQYKSQQRSSYSTIKNDVWSFGCLLLKIFGSNSDSYIQHFIDNPNLLEKPIQVQLILQSCLGIKSLNQKDYKQQTKLKSILSLLINIFTTEFQRYNMENVCQHPFFSRVWNMV